MTAVIDYDFIKFEAACLAEERSIVVTHLTTGDQMEFSTRTDFYGEWRKKNGGWLAKANVGRDTPMLVSDFRIEDKQESKGIGMAINVANNRIESILAKLDEKSYYGYLTKGKSFREGLSTIKKYKGNRDTLLRPLLLDEVAAYIAEKHGGYFIEHYEVDDKVVMDWHEDKSLVVVGSEKDYMGCEITFFNPDTMDSPMHIKGLGGLWIDGKKQVKGHGRMWFYHQVLSSDQADNYAANSASSVKWGEKSSYNLLAPCKTDKECFEAMIKGYKTLYPVADEVVGWRGLRIENVDWLYMLNENFQLARMRRWEGDEFHVTTVLDKLGVKYET